jgi:RNA polymerase sigma factor (sigma-70 family)
MVPSSNAEAVSDSRDRAEAERFLANVVARGMAIAERLIDFDTASDITHEIAIEIWERRQRDPSFLADPDKRDAFIRTAIRGWMQPQLEQEAGELEQVIARVLSEMAPRRREVFLRVRDDEMSYEAVAREMNLSVKTVQAHVVRAQAALRAALAEFRKEER